MIRVGIVGYGFAGRGFHARMIQQVPGLTLSAVATRDPERRLQAETDWSIATYATLDELLAADAADLIILATPHNAHVEPALQAMAAGKHVVIDKPMCLSTADADRLIAARDQARVLLSVFHNRRWDWDYLTVRHALESGWIGAPYLFETAVLRYRGPRGWRGQAEAGGGLIFDWGAHLVDHALLLVPGPLADVSCEIQYRGWGAEAGSYARMQLRFASGVLYCIEIGNMAAILKPRWYVLGEQGALLKHGLDPQEPAWLAGDPSLAAEKPDERMRLVTMTDDGPDERTVDSLRGDWLGYYENVRDAIRGDAALAVRPEEARRVVAVLEAALASSQAHKPFVVE